MRRIQIAVLLAAVLTMSFTGCGKQITEEVPPTETTTAAVSETETQPETTTTATTTTTTASTTTTAASSVTVSTTTTAAQTTPAAAATTAPATAAAPKATTAATAARSVSSGAYTPARPQNQTPAPTPTPATEAPQPETTLSPEETPIEPPAGWTWYLDEAVYDGTCFAVPVKVKEDPGIFGYNLTLNINGMSIADAGFELVEIEEGDAYHFPNFLANVQKGSIAGAESNAKNNSIAGQEATVATYYLIPPADAQPGQTFEITITGLSVGNYANQKFNETNGIQLGALTLTIPEPAETTVIPSETPAQNVTEETAPPAPPAET